MEKNIYEWLNSNCKLIDIILILSSSGIIISHEKLNEFCKNNLTKGSCILNNQQFQILNDNLKSLNEIYKRNNTTIISPDIKELLVNHDEDEDKIKYNCSIIIIIKNNNKYIKSNQQQSHLQHQQIQQIRDIDQLFFKVWRNIIIQNEILFHTRLYNIHLNQTICISDVIDNNTLQQIKYKSYINKLTVTTKSYISLDSQSLLSYYPSALRVNNGGGNIKLLEGSIPTTVISLNLINHNQQFTNGIFPNSITELIFGLDNSPLSCRFNHSFNGNWLPSNLKTLKLNQGYQQPIKIGYLPNSLTQLTFHESYKGIIEPGSIPLSVKTLHYKFQSYDNKLKLCDTVIPISTTSLEFDNSFDQDIKEYDIPHNVTTIRVGGVKSLFNSKIHKNSLPLSLRSLYLGNCYDRSIQDTLPPGLTLIDMAGYDTPLPVNLFPSSITSIQLGNYNQPIVEGYFCAFKNLKTLKLNWLYNSVPANTLPESLTCLELGLLYEEPFNANVLPRSSLTSLTLGLHIKLEVNQLPASITYLSLYLDEDYIILPGAFPPNLKELYIKNTNFQQDLTINNILPSSLQTFYINGKNYKYLDNLNSNFVSKFIKIIN